VGVAAQFAAERANAGPGTCPRQGTHDDWMTARPAPLRRLYLREGRTSDHRPKSDGFPKRGFAQRAGRRALCKRLLWKRQKPQKSQGENLPHIGAPQKI